LAGLGAGAWFITRQVQAWNHLDAARDALERGESRLARRYLGRCLRTWPSSGEVHFLAAQAARRCGDLEEAREHLDRAAECGWVKEALDLERALWRVQVRELPAVEGYLLRCLELRHPDSVLIVEILTPAYLQNYQLDSAQRCADLWVDLAPQNPAAWHARGVLAEGKQSRHVAMESFLEAVRLGPTRRDSRQALVRALVRANRPADARPHLEELLRQDPDDVDAKVTLAECHKGLGQTDEARRLLDQVLLRWPDHAHALHQRGKLELETGDAKQAAAYLRRAVAGAPFDKEVLYTWQRCLERPGVAPPEEAAEWKKRLQAVEADLRLLNELTSKIPKEPGNAELRRSAGEVLLRNGQEAEGLRWLRSALAVQPDHAATHQTLAGYYEAKGNVGLAMEHRAAATRGSKP
jgi:tetratricopeptide (TPR) repeat protein